jgi:L-ascorbate 6-phosphate lactonase
MLKEPPGDYKRMVEVPIEPEDVKTDFVIATHDHVDHLDPWSILDIAKANPKAKFIGPYSCCYHFLELGVKPDRVVELNGGETTTIDKISLTAFSTFHLNDSISFYLREGDITLCFLSDAAYSPNLIKAALKDNESYQPLDILIIAANGRAGNLDARNSVFFSARLRPKVVIPMHYGMFKETHSDPMIVVRALEESDLDLKPVVMEFKGSYMYSH